MSNCGSCSGGHRETIYCYKCGQRVGEVNTKVPGKRRIGCPKCGGQTDVRVYGDGSIKTW